MARKWFKTASLANNIAGIEIYSDIGFGGLTVGDFSAAMRRLRSPREIHLSISSDGGDISTGFAIYNILNRHPARKIVTIEGLAASMASVIAMAGDEVIMPSNAQMMIHNPWGSITGESDQIVSFGEALAKMGDAIAQAYIDRTGLSKKDIVAMMNRETWLTAERAVDLGFADRIEKAVAVASLRVDLSKFQNPPALFARVIAAAAKAKEEKEMAWTYSDQINAICNLFDKGPRGKELAAKFIAANTPRAEVLERLAAMAEKARRTNDVFALRAGRETQDEFNTRVRAETAGHSDSDFAAFAAANSKAYFEKRGKRDAV